MKELVVMIGLPRSGKSTYVDGAMSASYYNFDIICADDIRLALGVQFDPKLEPFVWATHNTMLRAKMVRGRSVILDETTTVMDRIKKYYYLCKEFDYSLNLLYLATPMEECLKRNVGEGSVPDEVIIRMNNQLIELLNELDRDPKYTYTTIK